VEERGGILHVIPGKEALFSFYAAQVEQRLETSCTRARSLTC
jgi:hypothetical protein